MSGSLSLLRLPDIAHAKNTPFLACVPFLNTFILEKEEQPIKKKKLQNNVSQTKRSTHAKI